MARETLNGKANRALMLLLGLRYPSVREGLERYGMAASDVDEGWALLRALGESRPTRGLDGTTGSLRDDPVWRALDGWENVWLPIAEVVIKRHAPGVAERFWSGIKRSSGPEVVWSVRVFVDRVKGLEELAGAQGRLVREKLAQRGLRDEVLEEAEGLLHRMMGLEVSEGQLEREREEAKRQSSEEAEAALWGWYLEWSTVGRLALKGQARLLRQAGLAPSGSKGRGGAEEGGASEDPL